MKILSKILDTMLAPAGTFDTASAIDDATNRDRLYDNSPLLASVTGSFMSGEIDEAGSPNWLHLGGNDDSGRRSIA